MKDQATMHVKDVFESMQSSVRGLSTEEANKRLATYGPNVLVEKKRVPIVYRFIANLKDLFSVLLLFASLLAVFVDWTMSVIILAVVLVNTCSASSKSGAQKKPWKR